MSILFLNATRSYHNLSNLMQNFFIVLEKFNSMDAVILVPPNKKKIKNLTETKLSIACIVLHCFTIVQKSLSSGKTFNTLF